MIVWQVGQAGHMRTRTRPFRVRTDAFQSQIWVRNGSVQTQNGRVLKMDPRVGPSLLSDGSKRTTTYKMSRPIKVALTTLLKLRLSFLRKKRRRDPNLFLTSFLQFRLSVSNRHIQPPCIHSFFPFCLSFLNKLDDLVDMYDLRRYTYFNDS